MTPLPYPATDADHQEDPMEEHFMTSTTTTAEADAFVRRARWSSLTPPQGASAVRRRQARARARRDPHEPVVFRTVGLMTVMAAGSAALWYFDRSPVWMFGFVVMALCALATLALLIVVEVGHTHDERLPDVIPPLDDASLDYRAEQQNWQPAPRWLHVRPTDENPDSADALISTQVNPR